jgi:hypothetical protein
VLLLSSAHLHVYICLTSKGSRFDGFRPRKRENDCFVSSIFLSFQDMVNNNSHQEKYRLFSFSANKMRFMYIPNLVLILCWAGGMVVYTVPQQSKLLHRSLTLTKTLSSSLFSSTPLESVSSPTSIHQIDTTPPKFSVVPPIVFNEFWICEEPCKSAMMFEDNMTSMQLHHAMYRAQQQVAESDQDLQVAWLLSFPNSVGSNLHLLRSCLFRC